MAATHPVRQTPDDDIPTHAEGDARRLVMFAGADIDHALDYTSLEVAGVVPDKRFDLAGEQDVVRLVDALVGAWGVVAGHEAITRDVIEQSPTLRVIIRPGLGYDRVDVDAASDCGVLVVTTPDTIEPTVADLTVALMLAVGRRLLDADRAVRSGSWRIEPVLTGDLTGSVVSLIGLGRIGRLVAERVLAFDTTVLAVDPLPDVEFCRRHGIRMVDLDEALRMGDFVSLHVPLAPGTMGLIGAREIGLMKPGAIIVNTARGELVDEAALAAALFSGRLAGAGVDAFRSEPPLSDDPLLAAPNTVLSGHVGWATRRATLAMYRAALEGAREAATGRVPAQALNPQAWPAT